MILCTMTPEQLEAALIKHLEESGGIRADLMWLKRAFWTLATAMVTFNITMASGIILVLLKVKP